jgi:hypothetical protein
MGYVNNPAAAGWGRDPRWICGRRISIQSKNDEQCSATHAILGRQFLFRETQRNPVTANNTRFRSSGQSVPVFSTDRPKQPQSMLNPRRIALSNAPENITSKTANQTSAPLSHRPNKRQIPTHSSKAGRKTAKAAVPGQGVS